MEEEILTMAKVIAKPEAGEEAYLRTLCACLLYTSCGRCAPMNASRENPM